MLAVYLRQIVVSRHTKHLSQLALIFIEPDRYDSHGVANNTRRLRL